MYNITSSEMEFKNYRKYSYMLAGRPLVIETGKMAGLANGSRGGRSRSALLLQSLSQVQLGDDGAVPLDVHLLEVAEEVAPMSYHLQKSPAAVVILHVGSQMLGQGVDAIGQDSDLDFRRAGVTLMDGILRDDSLLFCYGHGNSPFSFIISGIGTATGW